MTRVRRRLLAASISTAVGGMILASVAAPVFAQDRPGEDIQKLQAIEVTGSRIKKADIEGQIPVVTISAKDIQESGLASIGDVIQQLSVSGSSLNTKFNSAGNFGFAADGSGVGSGSTTISLRNLNAKRTLILVDGLRWVNESSASGVSAAVDLNTIPASAVERIEILTDGASSLYGSDAIAGVVNIITKRRQEGTDIGLYYGDYSIGDGKTYSGHVSFGANTDRMQMFLDLSHYSQHRISSADWEQSYYPTPGFHNGVSSYTPYTRSVFLVPGGGDITRSDGTVICSGVCSITANGVAPAGGVQDFPDGFHHFKTSDRFNFAPYNLLLTPSERTGVFGQARYKVTDDVTFYAKGLYNTRKSTNQAGPEPIGLGAGFGTSDLGLVTGVDVTNPYNPFGFTLDPNSNLIGIGRRPVEGGPRVFKQDVDTRYIATGLEGAFSFSDRNFFWDVNYVNSDNRATQTVHGTYNAHNIKEALGPLAACQADPGCVPLNIFGGPGTITPEMLQYIQFIENDRSDNKLEAFTANLSGSIFELPAGSLGFATGYEHRHLSGFYTPDSIVTEGWSNGVPSLPTSGSYDVDEFYVELNAPIVKDAPFAKSLDLSLASRYSDYSTFGGTTNNKLGVRWQFNDDLTLRSTWAEGFRAPSIGELYGSPARFDATINDPCAGATGQSAANCIAQGVPDPSTFQAANPQISTRTGGNINLQPETSKSLTAGVVYSPSWATDASWSQKLDFEATWWKYKVNNAIQAPDAQTQLDRCVATNDPVFCNGITRSTLSGDIIQFNNFLQNLGRIDTKGFDLGVNWAGPQWSFGRLGANWSATRVSSYKSVATDSGLAEPLAVGIETTDKGIPEWRSSLRLSWVLANWSASWTMRYLSDLTEQCSQDWTANGATCSKPNADQDNNPGGTNHIGATTFHDVRVGWKVPVNLDLNVAAGINNVFDKEPPVCVSCSLNGYDASNYDLPGRFWYVEANIKF